MKFSAVYKESFLVIYIVSDHVVSFKYLIPRFHCAVLIAALVHYKEFELL